MDRSSLIQQVLNTLPVFVPGRDRAFEFAPDGTLVYHHPDPDFDWEEPVDILGFERSESEPWVFVPTWDNCPSRLYTAVRLTRCGCVGLIARCNDPRAKFTQRVDPTVCSGCPFSGDTDV